ncbi:MAG TPA: DUF362 domain-containing protein [Armatimonadota bacterium]|jgi:uncharacterized protein (DUF362 family)
MPYAVQLPPDPPVALLRCPSYDLTLVRALVRRAVDLVGGIGKVLRPRETVLLKPNLLSKRTPEEAVTTHPNVVRAVAELVLEAGGEPFIADSPSFYPIQAVAGPTGMADVAQTLGIPLVPLRQPVRVTNRWTPSPKSFHIDRLVLEADVVINLPKVKSHRQLRLTGAVKNLYGCMPGKRKALWHALARNNDPRFSEGVLAVALAAGSTLTIMDGIVAMEGDGPAEGTPRDLGLLMAGADPISVDTVLGHLLGAPAEDTLIHDAARRLGLGQTALTQIELLGDPPATLAVPDFRFPDLIGTGFSLPHLVLSAWKSYELAKGGS